MRASRLVRGLHGHHWDEDIFWKGQVEGRDIRKSARCWRRAELVIESFDYKSMPAFSEYLSQLEIVPCMSGRFLCYCGSSIRQLVFR